MHRATAVTYSRYPLDFAEPDPCHVDIVDIGLGLSKECRWNGQMPPDQFLTVAQHCVMASELLQPELQFEGLMHDAEEAYARDLATPLKALIPQYSEVVARITRAIRIRFDLPEFAHAPEVKEVDIHLGKLEYRTLFEGAALFKLWTPQEAFHRFIQRFEELYPVHLERLRERGIPTYQSQWAGSQLLSAPACTAEVAGMRRLRAEAPSA